MSKLIIPHIEPHHFHDSQLEEWAAIAEKYGATMALTYLAAATASNQLGQITTTGLYMSIHNGSPSNTGANEIVGNTGYTGTRMPVTWGSPSGGVVVSNDTQTFPLIVIQAGGIGYWGLWTAATAGTWLFGGATSGLSGSIPSGANVVFTSAITLTQAG
jgi:hypothetical protein